MPRHDSEIESIINKIMGAQHSLQKGEVVSPGAIMFILEDAKQIVLRLQRSLS